jgi:pimeloyl-ACP methyl ester carboxylesterase
MRKILLALAALAAVLAFLSAGNTASAANTIETYYKAQGSWAVSTGTANDGLGHAFHLWYPTNLGAGGYQHPILTWGNGTNATPSQYADTLDHLASWGFVVIASDSTQTGLGTEILAGAQYMVAKNSDPGSIFYQKLATNKIGAFGHSQGAGGTLNAVLLSPSLFKSAITNALPNPIWWSTPVPDMSQWPGAVPIWFSRGSTDTLIATESAAVTWYNSVPGAAAKATLKRANHNAIQKANNGYQGYYVAWFKYTLEGDTYARGAFVGSPPEINGNTNWQNQAEKNLP